MPAKPIPAGTRFTRLIVLRRGEDYLRPNGAHHLTSDCLCDCGKEINAANRHLFSGATKSCGCLLRDINVSLRKTHGQAGKNSATRTYRTWSSVVTRCLDENSHIFKKYGGRGIKLCQGMRSFDGFFSVMGERPLNMSIDRWPNNATGHYSCGRCEECLKNGWLLNVRWATLKQQGRNTRRNVIVTVNGITGCLSELCERFSVNYDRVRQRLKLAWSPEKAFFQPRQGQS